MPNISHSKLKLWRSMKNFKPTTQIVRINFLDESAFAGQVIDLEPFTIISGLHGSGKTTLLHYIAECMYRGSTSHNNPPFVGRYRWRDDNKEPLVGRVEIVLRDGATSHVIKRDLNVIDAADATTKGDLDEYVPCLITPFDSILINEFFDNYDFSSRKLRQIEQEVVHKRKDLDALREIVGVPYDEVIYIPSRVTEGAPIFPFVKARIGANWIDSSSMSYGELVVHKLRWEVGRAYEKSVILLDEPEANIAPRGHAALLDELARLARAAEMQVIMTTHSPAFINRVPQEWIRICVRRGRDASIFTPSRASDIRDALGVESPLNYFIVVEDEVAEAILRMILTTYGFPVLSEIEVLRAGSWTDVITSTSTLSTSKRTRSVAVLDGDQRNNASRFPAPLSILFLPGSEPPEKVLTEFAMQHPEALAKKLHCSLASINIYLSEFAAEEHHRWLSLLSMRTGQDRQYCLRAFFEIWHSDPVNAAEAEALSQQIEAFLTG